LRLYSIHPAEQDGVEVEAGPMVELLRNHKLATVIGSLGVAGIGVLWYVPPIYGVQFIQELEGLPAKAVTFSEMLAYFLPTVLAMFVGMLVDRIGAGRMHMITLVLGCLVAPGPLFYWWTHVARAQAVSAVFVGIRIDPAIADNAMAQTKRMEGGASTTGKNSGRAKNITRGVDLSGADYSGKKMIGVAFQQSIVRNVNFKNADVSNAGFFDADLFGTDFTGATMNQANLELARLTEAVLDNAIATEMYVSGTTKMNVKSINGTDFTGTFLRPDQKTYLCSIAKGKNPVTEVETRDSLGCDA